MVRYSAHHGDVLTNPCKHTCLTCQFPVATRISVQWRVMGKLASSSNVKDLRTIIPLPALLQVLDVLIAERLNEESNPDKRNTNHQQNFLKRVQRLVPGSRAGVHILLIGDDLITDEDKIQNSLKDC